MGDVVIVRVRKGRNYATRFGKKWYLTPFRPNLNKLHKKRSPHDAGIFSTN